MDVSIIIINYNTIKLLVDAIDSIFVKTEGINYEIIVVDNNSSDSAKTILLEKYGDKVRFIGLQENIGFGRANNEAVKFAQGRNLFFLNPDTILLNNAVKILSDFLDSDIYIGIVGGNLYTDDLQPTLSYDMLLPSLYWELNILFCDRLSRILFGANGYFNHSQQCLKVGYITGADMMVKKAILEKVGFFDPDFFMYYEETELTYRIRKRGYKVICIPQAKIVHFEGKSFSSNLERQKRLLVSRNLFYKKTHSQIYHLFANSICYLTAVSRIVIFTILRNKEKCKNWKFIIKNIRGE